MFSWEAGRPEQVSEAWKEILGNIKSSFLKKNKIKPFLQKYIKSPSKIKHKMHVEKNPQIVVQKT